MSVSPREVFFTNATDYYIAGRFAAFAGLAPTVGNLLHYAIEMYLKGGLSKTKNTAELRKLSHDLPDVWSEFKAQFRGLSSMDEFDSVDSALHAFEELRYPDSVLKKGMSCTISIKHPSSPAASIGAGASAPQYDLCFEDVDKLVATIFTVVHVNPPFFTGRLNKVARQWLKEENAESGLTSA